MPVSTNLRFDGHAYIIYIYSVLTSACRPSGELTRVEPNCCVRCDRVFGHYAVKTGSLEIQGDHRDVIIEALRKKGWTVKRSGG